MLFVEGRECFQAKRRELTYSRQVRSDGFPVTVKRRSKLFARKNAMPGSPPESLQFHVSIPLNRFEALISDLVAAARAPRDDPRISQILCQLQGLTIMVQTVQETIDANNAATATVIAGIQTDISTIAAELASLIPAPGSVVSQASADAMTANVAKLTAAKEALDGLITPPPPAPPATEPPPPAAVAFDATDTTPNAPGGRNTSHLPDFDPAVAETA